MKDAALFFRGLGESMNANMLKGVKDRLDRSRYDIIEVPYSATFGPIGSPDIFAKSLQASVDEAVRNAESIIDRYEHVALAGYSFGTLPVEALVKKYPKGTPRGNKIMIGATLASARRKPGRSFGLLIPPTNGGILGGWHDDTRLWCALAWPGDVVTSLPTNSLLRRVAPAIQYMSFSDLPAWARSLKAELPRIVSSEIGTIWEHMFDPAWAQQYGEMLINTGIMIDGYANRGEHTAKYNEKRWFDYKQNPVTALELMSRGLNGAKA